MRKENSRYFTVTDDKNHTIEYEILFTFSADETKKDYIVFTDNTKDESDSIITYAAVYEQNDDKITLKDIETENEWNLIENILAQIEDKVEE